MKILIVLLTITVLLLCGSDGPMFPVANLLGLGILALSVAVYLKRRQISEEQNTVISVRNYVTCDLCDEWYEVEPGYCVVCGEENEFTHHDGSSTTGSI